MVLTDLANSRHQNPGSNNGGGHRYLCVTIPRSTLYIRLIKILVLEKMITVL